MRRNPLNPFFSKRSISNVQPLIRSKVDQILRNIAKYKDDGKPFTISSAFMAYSGDVMMEYCFGHNYNHLDSPDFNDNLHNAFMAASRTGHMAVQFPMIPKLMKQLPDNIVVKMEPLYSLLFRLQGVSIKYTHRISNGPAGVT